MRLTILSFILLLCLSSAAQDISRPKLVVGIVVDQMRWDYLYRFQDRYSSGGFKRLLREGFSCENTLIPYTPTHTAPGHACVYTGSVPALHGIMGNYWYDRHQKRLVYCTEDTTEHTIGSNSTAGKMSPRLLWSSTITDELRLATNFRSKTISIAMKDRAAILPGGHASNGSYWFDNASGGWITSSFYMEQLPDWMVQFNSQKLPEFYMKQPWKPLFPISTYHQSTSDSNAFEAKMPGGDMMFPHDFVASGNHRYEAFRTSPAACTYTFETAKAAIVGEKLGADEITDFLAISLSSPDYIGHTFGPNSIEVEDTYLRLDRDLETFLKYLDARIGKGQYLVFLTSDHAAAHNPTFLSSHKIAGGSYDPGAVKRQLNDSLANVFHVTPLIEHYSNYQFFLNDSLIRAEKISKQEVKNYLSELLIKHHAISQVVDLANIDGAMLPSPVDMMVANGYNQKLSGDLQVIVKPQWMEHHRVGTSHGHWNPYDAHIPLLWFGWKVPQGKTNRQVLMTDIAATLAAILHIQAPSASIGHVIEEVVR